VVRHTPRPEIGLALDPEREIAAIIGPSGCGKSTLLRCFNRMNDLYPPVRYEGSVLFEGTDILRNGIDLVELRRRVGMVFQRANPFPMSIFQNVAYGPKLLGVRSRRELEQAVEGALRQSALWNEVKDRLNRHALGLSGGQQQRLCIARALAVKPEVLLLDEPASALDPTATAKIEELILEIRSAISVVIVTHNMQQAARISDRTAFLMEGTLVERGRPGTSSPPPGAIDGGLHHGSIRIGSSHGPPLSSRARRRSATG